MALIYVKPERREKIYFIDLAVNRFDWYNIGIVLA